MMVIANDRTKESRVCTSSHVLNGWGFVRQESNPPRATENAFQAIQVGFIPESPQCRGCIQHACECFGTSNFERGLRKQSTEWISWGKDEDVIHMVSNGEPFINCHTKDLHGEASFSSCNRWFDCLWRPPWAYNHHLPGFRCVEMFSGCRGGDMADIVLCGTVVARAD